MTPQQRRQAAAQAAKDKTFSWRGPSSPPAPPEPLPGSPEAFARAEAAAFQRLEEHDRERENLVAELAAIQAYAARPAGRYRVLRGAAWRARNDYNRVSELHTGDVINAAAFSRKQLDEAVCAGVVLEPIHDDDNGGPPCPPTTPKPPTAARRSTNAPSE